MADNQHFTLLVLGAGASYDYGLPLGSGLIEMIRKEAASSLFAKGRSDGTAFDNHLANVCGKRPSLEQIVAIQKIAQGIWFSQSIDTFINDSDDPEIEFVGKQLIGFLLSEAEKLTGLAEENDGFKNSIRSGKSRRGDQEVLIRQFWLTNLFRIVRGQVRPKDLASRLSCLKVINFNYDRLFSHFFLNALKLYDVLVEEEAAELLSEIELIHPYGSLGELPAMAKYSRNEANTLPFGTYSKGHGGIDFSKKIRTFNEIEHLDTDVANRIKRLVIDADKVVFLGFGFHKQNLDLLGLPFKRDTQDVISNSIGLSEYVKQNTSLRVNALLRYEGKLFKPGSRPQISYIDGDCNAVLDEFGSTLFEPSTNDYTKASAYRL